MESFHITARQLLYSSLKVALRIVVMVTRFEIGAHCIAAIVFIVLNCVLWHKGETWVGVGKNMKLPDKDYYFLLWKY